MSEHTLPQGWVWSTLGEVADYGKTIKVEPSEIKPNEWVLELEDIEKDSSKLLQRVTNLDRQSKSTKNRFFKGDALYGKLRPYLNKVLIADKDGVCTTEIIPITAPEGVDSRYLFYSLKRPDFIDYVSSISHGLNMPRLGTQAGKEAKFPLAPLNEQKRIADKLNQLLAAVDSCKTRLDTIPGIIKRFRQSVLAAATSGELTADWRGSNNTFGFSWIDNVIAKKVCLPQGVKRLSKQAFKPVKVEHSASGLPTTWHITTVGELYKLNVLIDFADGNHGGLYPRKEDFSDNGALFLTASQIGENWELDLDSCPRLNHEKARQLTKGWAQTDDVLLTHNATVGRVALLEGLKEKVLLGTSATFYRFNSDYIQPRFARIIFSSPFFQRQLEAEMEQTTRNQVPITKQVSLNFICPPVKEQIEIVRRVEALFAVADNLEARYQTSRTQVNQLTPALLAKAFRGELVPQDPDDEPAEKLLERIRAVKSATAVKPKRGRQKRA